MVTHEYLDLVFQVRVLAGQWFDAARLAPCLAHHKFCVEGQNVLLIHYTSYRRLKDIFYTERFKSRLEAEAREIQIKRWSREKKVALIQKDYDKLHELSKSRD